MGLRALLIGLAFGVMVGLGFVGSAGAEGPHSVAVLAAKLSPAVVNISSTHPVAGGSGVPFPTGPEGSVLDRHLNEGNPNAGQDNAAEAESLGSGFIISADGLIVTNNHVIAGADDMEVYLTDGTRLAAKLVGADPETDLAVLRVHAGHPLPFVRFGDSDTAQVGDWVMAIGNPFGLGGSVTLGIVSARNRDIQSGPYDSFIQTDASINQGNSGGPLFDMNGDVVGINTAIIARGGLALGIGFAVPGKQAQPVVEQLIKYGATRRGWLGVGVENITDEIAVSLGRPDTHGALVTEVSKPGPADGVIEAGDIILDFNGTPVNVMRDLPRLVASTAIGAAVKIEVLRDGVKKELSVTLGRLETGGSRAAVAVAVPPVSDNSGPPGTDPTPSLAEQLGFSIAALDALNRKTYGLDSHARGLVVTEVTKGTDAYKKGVLSGFLITKVNEHRTETVAEIAKIVDGAREAGRPLVLLQMRDPTGGNRFIAVKLN